MFEIIIGPETLFNPLSFMCLFVDFDRVDAELFLSQVRIVTDCTILG